MMFVEMPIIRVNNPPSRFGPSLATALAAVLASTVCAAPRAINELANPGFEESTGTDLAAWHAYGRGHAIDREVAHGGQQAIRCEARGSQDATGAAQVIRYDKPDKRPIVVGGWSKADDVDAGGDYCVYLDIFFEDGSPWWGQMAGWSRGRHDWQYTAQVFYPEKPVKEIQTFVLLRRTSGTAWFDDIFVCRGGRATGSVGEHRVVRRQPLNVVVLEEPK